MTQRLQVRVIISATLPTRDDVINICCRSHDSLLLAMNTKRMLAKKSLAGLTPSPPIPARVAVLPMLISFTLAHGRRVPIAPPCGGEGTAPRVRAWPLRGIPHRGLSIKMPAGGGQNTVREEDCRRRKLNKKPEAIARLGLFVALLTPH